MIKITKTSFFTGNTNSMELPITLTEYEEYINGDECVQNKFPQLSPDHREFLMTGATPEEWNNMFPDEGDDEGNAKY